MPVWLTVLLKFLPVLIDLIERAWPIVEELFNDKDKPSSVKRRVVVENLIDSGASGSMARLANEITYRAIKTKRAMETENEVIDLGLDCGC